MDSITLERGTSKSKFKIGDKVRYKGLKRVGIVVDVVPFDEDSFAYLVKYGIFKKIMVYGRKFRKD